MLGPAKKKNTRPTARHGPRSARCSFSLPLLLGTATTIPPMRRPAGASALKNAPTTSLPAPRRGAQRTSCVSHVWRRLDTSTSPLPSFRPPISSLAATAKKKKNPDISILTARRRPGCGSFCSPSESSKISYKPVARFPAPTSGVPLLLRSAPCKRGVSGLVWVKASSPSGPPPPASGVLPPSIRVFVHRSRGEARRRARPHRTVQDLTTNRPPAAPRTRAWTEGLARLSTPSTQCVNGLESCMSSHFASARPPSSTISLPARWTWRPRGLEPSKKEKRKEHKRTEIFAFARAPRPRAKRRSLRQAFEPSTLSIPEDESPRRRSSRWCARGVDSTLDNERGAPRNFWPIDERELAFSRPAGRPLASNQFGPFCKFS